MTECLLFPSVLIAQATNTNVALISFVIYLVAVMALAWLSGFFESKEGFASEYFLGGRNLGVWAFALTFAATSASGGSFVGFPALIYEHGWSLALWIAGYMLVPLVAMGLLGKRLNDVGRRAGALTIPEVFRERFGSRILGAVASLVILIFMFFYLLAQFKAGSEILASLLQGIPGFEVCVRAIGRMTQQSSIDYIATSDPHYLFCLFVFSVAVVGYVVYGGFRAVVWTDVMQGIVMFFGVLILLYLTVSQAGGLSQANTELAQHTPPRFGSVQLLCDTDTTVEKGTWILAEGHLLRTKNRIKVIAQQPSKDVEVIELTTASQIQKIPESSIRQDVRLAQSGPPELQSYAAGADEPGTYLSATGPDAKKTTGFIGLGVAFSFFMYWTFSGAGQPSNMVRLMAFKDTKTLRLSIVSVSLYFSFIYFSLVVIFCCARVILPGLEFSPDRAMPELAVHTTSVAGVPWLAGLLLAAPFAAVMSSVDSFLLLVSSSLVRDIYQGLLAPHASERQLKRVTYSGTVAMGVLATIFAVRPPDYLQDLIVFAGGGLSATFLVPMAFCLYWRKMNLSGAFLGMLAGFATHLFFTNMQIGVQLVQVTGIEPFIWDLVGSTLGVLIGTFCGGQFESPDKHQKLVERFF